MSELAVHPAAELFPRMNEIELKELAADIKEHGLNEPIVHSNGHILDGRNRLRACEIAGVEPRFAEWSSEDSPVAYVLSANLHRRHLTTSQKAMIAVEARILFEAEAREQKGGRPPTHKPSPTPEAVTTETAQRAAELVGVSKTTVYDAARVKREDPYLAEEIRQGKRSVDSACKQLAQQSDTAPTRPQLPKTKRQRQVARATKERVERVVGTCNALARGLDDLKVELAIPLATQEEIRAWNAALGDASSALRRLRGRVKEVTQ